MATAVDDGAALKALQSVGGVPQKRVADLLLSTQGRQGNAYVQRLVENLGSVQRESAVPAVQRVEDEPSTGAHPGGGGPGKIEGAEEEPYDVSGTTLSDIGDQLKRFDGHASETFVALTIDGEVMPEKVKGGGYKVTVEWKAVDGVVRLPRWTGYDEGSVEDQTEWDRFMRQVRKHEQEAHVDMAEKWVKGLKGDDITITGATVEELQSNLQAKLEELGGRLQDEHDKCDHGKSIDAFLHPPATSESEAEGETGTEGEAGTEEEGVVRPRAPDVFSDLGL